MRRLYRTPLCLLRDYIPLKQGLRRIIILIPLILLELRDYIPLKQGLRPWRVPWPVRLSSETIFH